MHQFSTSNYIRFHMKSSGLLNCGHIELLLHKLKPLHPHYNISKHISNTLCFFYLILKQAITDGKADTHYCSKLSVICLLKKTTLIKCSYLKSLLQHKPQNNYCSASSHSSIKILEKQIMCIFIYTYKIHVYIYKYVCISLL